MILNCVFLNGHAHINFILGYNYITIFNALQDTKYQHILTPTDSERRAKNISYRIEINLLSDCN